MSYASKYAFSRFLVYFLLLNKLDILKERLNSSGNNNLDANELNLLVKFINSYLLLNNVDDLIEIGQTKGQKYALYNYIDYYINDIPIQWRTQRVENVKGSINNYVPTFRYSRMFSLHEDRKESEFKRSENSDDLIFSRI